MSWRYKYPTREWWETDEEFNERCEAYERAEDEYADSYRERF